MASTSTMTSGIENPMNSTNSYKQKSSKPFMKLNLETIPDSFKTKVSMQHQCYRLVPDDLLSPNDEDDYENDVKDNDYLTSDKKIFNSTPKNNCQHKRRQLPKIPSDKKPFGKIWQMGQNSIDQQSKNLAKSLRWKLTMANMLLEIKTDSSTGKTLSIKMLNDDYVDDDDNNKVKENDNNNDYGNNDKENIIFSSTEQQHSQQKQTNNLISTISDDHSSLDWSHDDTMSMMMMLSPDKSSLTTEQSSHRQHHSRLTNTSSDSGVSSNIDSPSTTAISSFNEKIEFFESKSSMTSNDANDDCDNEGDEQKSQLQQSQSETNLKPVNKLPDATHRALFKFCARHPDEIDLQIGDAIYLYEEFDDQWSDGLNLRTGYRGIFPSSLVIDVNYSEFMFETDANPIFHDSNPFIDFRIQRDRFNLDFLGSIEVFKAKGEDVLDESIRRVSIGVQQSTMKSSAKFSMNIPFNCLIEVSDIGIRMIDNSSNITNLTNKSRTTSNKHDYFFALVQITYCGYQFKNNVYYFAFITRHPSIQTRFACHVFKGVDCSNTRDVAESVGRAFHRFYNRFVQITFPMDTTFN
uniref:C-Jun-amino-terminal kinase-interacting protein 2-like n=1 Tax=Dermatophagoides pteronyssinus TaxID=6956 RepID=A0A6P6YG21_DERPT|nr:C-Jun-amino-terminal kinase-interacting protein 2-like [Dermatophagoides pteronyssinus]